MGHNGERQLHLDISLVPVLKPNFKVALSVSLTDPGSARPGCSLEPLRR